MMSDAPSNSMTVVLNLSRETKHGGQGGCQVERCFHLEQSCCMHLRSGGSEEEEVALLSELKENPAWLSVPLPELEWSTWPDEAAEEAPERCA